MITQIGKEIDLLQNFPKVKRDIQQRSEKKTEEDRAIARQFGKEFFDGSRKCGYGGYHYHPKFWQGVVRDFQNYYHLTPQSKVLDVGCAKGFLLYDFMKLIPGIEVAGIDISSYAIEQSPAEIKPFLKVADARKIPFPDRSFDLVISINTVHNFEGQDLAQSFQEIERVSKGNSFIVVDAYRNQQEKELLYHWNLTARSILPVEDWKTLFKRVGYSGDYFWFIP